MIENILVKGLLNSCVYAMIALGFSLIFGVARIINLSHTAFYMIAAYGIFLFNIQAGLNPILSIVLSILVVSVLGVLSYRYLIDPVRERETSTLIVTIAIALMIQEIIFILFGGHYRGAVALISGHSTLLGVRVTNQYILTLIVVMTALVVVWYILMKTRLGIAIRSVAQNREIANLMGIDVRKVAVQTMTIAVALAALAGAMVAPIYVLEPHMWINPLVIILAIVILGGLGSIKGTLISAFILGFTEVLVIVFIPGGAFLKVTFALALMVIILLIRPEGLFGVFLEGER